MTTVLINVLFIISFNNLEKILQCEHYCILWKKPSSKEGETKKMIVLNYELVILMYSRLCNEFR